MDAETNGHGEAADPARRISALVRAIVERAAPEELPMVDGLSVADDETIVARLTRRPPRDERLGFGVDDVTVLLTPVLYIVLDEALRKIVGGSLDGLGRRLRRVARRRKTTPVLDLSPQQITEIAARVTEVARERGVPEEKVDGVAEAVAEVLADLPDDQDTTKPDRADPPDGDETPP
jgi:hypothetical protein